MIRFVVPGEPHAKERARGGQGRFYTPKDTVIAEETVRQYAELARAQKKLTAVSGNFWFGATFYLGMKPSKRGWKLAHNPDLDNLVKLVQDAINGVFWLDDRQVRGYLPGTKKVIAYKFPQTIIVIAHEDELSQEQLASWGELPK